MKKTIKIDFRRFWPEFDKKSNFYTTTLEEIYNVKIDEENPDYIFYSVYSSKGPKNVTGIGKIIKSISPKLYGSLRKGFGKFYSFIFNRKNVEDVRAKGVTTIFCGNEYAMPEMDKYDWAFGAYFEEVVGSNRYMRIPPYFIIENQLENWGIPPIKKKLNFDKIKKEKTKFCNFLYSNEVLERNEFFKKLNSYKRVDSPGRCMNNMAAIGSTDPLKSRHSKSWPAQKMDFLKEYKFTIAYENFTASGWVTEKLTNPMIVNSIPIYVGPKDVDREFNTRSFINYNDFKNMEDFIEHIKKVDNDDNLWKRYLEEPWYVGNKHNEYTEKEKYIKRFKEIFG